jgi:hypothetical protein
MLSGATTQLGFSKRAKQTALAEVIPQEVGLNARSACDRAFNARSAPDVAFLGGARLASPRISALHVSLLRLRYVASHVSKTCSTIRLSLQEGVESAPTVSVCLAAVLLWDIRTR